MVEAMKQIDDYGPEHSDQIQSWGQEVVRLPHSVFIYQPGNSGTVRTNEGQFPYSEDDYIATDPQTNRVWVIDSEYLDLHYRPVGDKDVEPEKSIGIAGPDYRREQALSQAVHAKKNMLAASMSITELAEEFYLFLIK